MRTFTPKVGRVVRYVLPSGKRRACVITTVVSGQTVHLKAISAGTVYSSKTENNTHGATDCWRRM